MQMARSICLTPFSVFDQIGVEDVQHLARPANPLTRLTRMTVALSAGWMYAADGRHTPTWRFREGFPHFKALRADAGFLSN